MIIRLTGACNNRCAFCLVDDEIERGIVRPIEEIAAEVASVPADETIDIFGGEPTINPYFWKVLELALASGRIVTLATNCRIFGHAPAARRLAALGDSRLLVRTSLLGGRAELHDRLNGVQGHAFEQTIAGIANLTALGFEVQTNIVLLADNLDELMSTIAAAIAAGSRQIKLSGLIRTGRVGQMIPDPEQVRSRLTTVIPVARALGASIKLEKLTPCLVPQFLAVLHRESDPASGAGWFRKTGACEACAFSPACDGAEQGALERFGEGWLRPLDTVPDTLVDRVEAGAIHGYVPDETKPIIQLNFPDDIGETLDLLPAIAAFRVRNPHIYMLA